MTLYEQVLKFGLHYRYHMPASHVTIVNYNSLCNFFCLFLYSAFTATAVFFWQFNLIFFPYKYVLSQISPMEHGREKNYMKRKQLIFMCVIVHYSFFICIWSFYCVLEVTAHWPLLCLQDQKIILLWTVCIFCYGIKISILINLIIWLQFHNASLLYLSVVLWIWLHLGRTLFVDHWEICCGLWCRSGIDMDAEFCPETWCLSTKLNIIIQKAKIWIFTLLQTSNCL
jgi:hypothetical protein